MKFNPGQTRKVVNGIAYIKDIPKTQVNPPVIELKVEPIKEKSNELQHKLVDEKPILEGSGTSGKSGPTNQPSTPRKSGI
jgi:hypothetical protein